MICPDINQRTVLLGAVQAWGIESQFQMAFGECGEFVALAGRRAQGRATDEEFISEIADVIVMMAQMREKFGPKRVDAMVDFKIDRLKGRILEHYNAKETLP